jgi:predicted permease
MILVWPLYVVITGVLVGILVTKICKTPLPERCTVYAACGFGNSTGLPITLLTVMHSSFPESTSVDPTVFLSAYLLLFPVLQWGLGGWLLAPPPSPSSAPKATCIRNHSFRNDQNKASTAGDFDPESLDPLITDSAFSIGGDASYNCPVLRNEAAKEGYLKGHAREGASSQTEGQKLLEGNAYETTCSCDELVLDADSSTCPAQRIAFDLSPPSLNSAPVTEVSSPPHSCPEQNFKTTHLRDKSDVWDGTVPLVGGSTIQLAQTILKRCCEPPVIGAISGIVCAYFTPLRRIFVDMDSRRGQAPLQWCFDALHLVGTAAVPINMMILGCNLSASFSARETLEETSNNASRIEPVKLLSVRTMIGVVLGKLVVHPLIGILSVVLLRQYVWHIPKEIERSFYLTLQIVFLTPTANNVMVMVELSSSPYKEGVARVIALQYAVAPLISSITMMIATGIASRWT